jgi:hypothetical protein
VAHVQTGPGEGIWREQPGLAAGLEADLDGPFGRVSGGVADALDRIRFGLGQVLREGPRAILFEAERRAGHAGLLDRALLLARHLDFEGIHVHWPDRPSHLGTTPSGSLVEAAIEACGARPGLEEGWPSDPGVERASPSPEPQIDGTRAVRGEAEELAQLAIRSAGERPLLLAIEGFEGDPRPLLEGLIVGARSPSGREERPILVVVTSRRLQRGDSKQASEGAARQDAAASRLGDPLGRVSARVDSFRLVAPDRVHLDRWLRVRGIDPLPETLADALVRHLAGRSGSVEGVLDRLAHEGEAAALEVGQGSEGPEVPPATARATGVMRRVPSDAGRRRRHDAETG